jgi:hypothetical protein
MVTEEKIITLMIEKNMFLISCSFFSCQMQFEVAMVHIHVNLPNNYLYTVKPGLGQKPPGYKPRTKSLDKKPPNNEKYKLFIYWYLCTHFGLIVPLFMG